MEKTKGRIKKLVLEIDETKRIKDEERRTTKRVLVGSRQGKRKRLLHPKLVIE